MHFSLQPYFLKAIFAKFPGWGVLLGESQVHSILSLLILIVQFDGHPSVLLDKSPLPHLWPETQADLCIHYIKVSLAVGKDWFNVHFCQYLRFHDLFVC